MKEKWSFEQLQQKVVEVMTDHIGEDNPIESADFFEKVYGHHPDDFDIYERKFYWDAILKANSRLRLDNKLFIITRYLKSFVLQSYEELEAYHKNLDSRKRALEKLRKNSEIWVNKKSWRKLKKKKKKLVMVQ